MLDLNSCYKLLHLEEDCSDLQVRQRYRKFALEMHPDKVKIEKEEGYQDQDGFVKIS